VITPKDHGHRSDGEDRTDRKLSIGVTFRHVRMDDVRVTHIDHTNLIAREVKRIVFVIVSARVAERKQSGSFANAERSETRARAPLSAHVVGHAQYGCVCIDGIPIDTRRRFAESAVSNKRQVQAAAQIDIFSHVRLLRGARDSKSNEDYIRITDVLSISNLSMRATSVLRN
jgi:hypothetical protein